MINPKVSKGMNRKLIIKRCRYCPHVYIDSFSSKRDRCEKNGRLLKINNLNKIPEHCPLPMEAAHD